jgi:hypothetical protein
MLCIACEKFPADDNGLCVSCNDDLFAGGYDATYVAEKLLKRITELEANLLRAIGTLEQATIEATGADYAEGCKP